MFTRENRYLIYQLEPSERIRKIELRMLTNNEIPGLAATQYTQSDDRRFIQFNVAKRIEAAKYLEGDVTKAQLIGVFKGIAKALNAAEEYMIDKDCIRIDLNYIFVDVSTKDTVLICLPVEEQRRKVNLIQFFKEIMFNVKFSQTENGDYVARIMSYLNSTSEFSSEDFGNLLEELQQKPQNQQIGAIQNPQEIPQNQAPSQMQGAQTSVQAQSPLPSLSAQAPQSMMQQKSWQPQQPQVQYAQIQQAQIQQAQIQQAQIQQAPVKQAQAQAANQPAAEQKKMSLFGLLMHYNKDNAAAYKAQKEAAKAGKNVGANAASMSVPAMTPNTAQGAPVTKPPQKKKKEKHEKESFAVPNQQSMIPNSQVSTPKQEYQVPSGIQGQSIRPASQIPQNTYPPQMAVRQQPVQPQVQMAQQASPNGGQPMFSSQVQFQSAGPQQGASYTIQQKSAAPGQSINFGETTVLGGGGGIGETTVLGAVQQEQQRPHLVRMKNNERIMVDKPVFRIGKERSYVDYFVGDNPAVSRSHANIISRDGTYFIMDTNSTNHTYVNGGMIQSNAEVKLFHGTKIRLANEEFEFRLY